MHLVRVVADERDRACRRSVKRPGVYGDWRKTRRADDEERVVRREPLAQPRPVGRAGSRRTARWSCGKPARAPNDSWNTGATSRSASSTSAAHVSASSAPAPDDERRRASRSRGRLRARRPPPASTACARSTRAGRRVLALVVGRRCSQSSIGTITSAGPRCGRRLVVRALDRAGNVLRPHRLLDPDRVVAGEAARAGRRGTARTRGAGGPAGRRDDERRAVHARRRERADGVAEPGGRVDERERRLAAADRVAGREPDDRALVQPEHEAQVVGQPGEERHLGRAGVREERRQPAPAEDVERRVADGRLTIPRPPRRPRRSGAASPTARPR